MFFSQRKLEANRANAQKSTGPRSPEAKAKVAQNRTTHGLTGAFRLLPGEDVEQFEATLNQYMIDEKPVGIAEIELVQTMVQHLWMARRADRCQTACFLVEQTPEQALADEVQIEIRPELERFLRYQAHHYRQYQKASAELLKRKKERRLAEHGFESQKRAQRQEERRDARENRDIETHRIRYATAQKRFEYAEIKTMTAAAKFSKHLDVLAEAGTGLIPPKTTKIAA